MQLTIQQIINNSYVQAAAIVSIFIIISLLILYISKKHLMKVAKRTKTKLDDLILEKTEKPFAFIIIFVGLNAALVRIQVTNTIIKSIIDSIIILLIMNIVAHIVDIAIRVWSEKLRLRTNSAHDDEIIPFLRSFSKLFIIIITILMILNKWGVKITPLLTSLGIAGLAVGLALQDTLKNIMGGISLVLDKNFTTGDIVKLDTGEVGEVIDIGLRSTKIKTYDNELLIIPNGVLSNLRIINYAKPSKMERVIIPVGVAYGSNVNKVKKILLDSTKIVQDYLVETKKPYVFFKEFSDSSINFELRFFIRNYKNKFESLDKVRSRIYNDLNKAKIKIPFPSREVYIKKTKK